MDTISRENNSPLPLAGVIIGAAALILAGVTFISLTKEKAIVAAQADKVARIDDIASQVSAASSAADKAKSDITSLQNSTQGAVTQIANDLAAIHEQIKHLEEVRAPKAGKHAAGGGGEPVVAGPGEYIVKAGDTGSKIARANGTTLADLESVNPGVSWTHLKVGEKLKLPEKAK